MVGTFAIGSTLIQGQPGVAVNAGVAFVGNIGGPAVDLTARGDPINVAVRMQQRAAAGELLVARE